MAVLCREQKLLYICIPKTGSTSISTFLMNELDGEWIPKESIVDEDGMITVDKKHSKIKELLNANLINKEKLSSLTVFATVRNPFDMVVSNYFFEKQIYDTYKFGIWKRMLLGAKVYFFLRKKLHIDKNNVYSWIMPQAKRYMFTVSHSFEEYVAKFYSQKSENMYLDYTRGADTMFLKLENIKEELEHLFDQIGVKKEVKLPHLSKSHMKRKEYQNYYTDAAKKIVEHSFKDELERFGYEF